MISTARSVPLGRLLCVLPRGLVALEVLAVGPAILQVAVKVAPILIAVARIAPKISGVNAPILGEVGAILDR
jgi:hypothetical protein